MVEEQIGANVVLSDARKLRDRRESLGWNARPLPLRDSAFGNTELARQFRAGAALIECSSSQFAKGGFSRIRHTGSVVSLHRARKLFLHRVQPRFTP